MNLIIMEKVSKIYQEVNTITDINTGEVQIIENTIVRKVKASEFVQVYLEDLSGILSISTGSEIKLLAVLWKASEWNEENSSLGNRIVIVKALKEQWAKQLEVNIQTLNNILTSLIKKNLLINQDRSIYYLNPKYFFKGFSKDRDKVVKTIISYEISKEVQDNSQNWE
jgi:hypothetical protein